MTAPRIERDAFLARDSLRKYDEALLRRVAANLCKPRNHWPIGDLIERCVEVFSNPPTLDRRLKVISPAGRQLLAVIGHSRQPRWLVGSLIEIATVLASDDALTTVLELLDAGLLFPILREGLRLRNFQSWLLESPAPEVLAPTPVTDRALGEPLPLEFPPAQDTDGPIREADGLDWPLRLAVLWQIVGRGPLRRTQQLDFFKRDLDRLRSEALLAAPDEALADLPDPALFAAALAQAVGLLKEVDGEVRAGDFPKSWEVGLAEVLADLWAAFPRISTWNSFAGWAPSFALANPFPTANLLALLALATVPDDGWADPEALADWVGQRHPYWREASALDAGATSRGLGRRSLGQATGVARFLLAVAYPLRLCQARRRHAGGWALRLSPLGRWVLRLTPNVPEFPVFSQTLLVQPNLEVLAYRQGLTPHLLAQLTRFATWKTLGAACTLQLEPQSVYRALENGETQASIVQSLERHGMKTLPSAVLEALKTWSNKRNRITVYPAAVLLEFATADELNEALARGLPLTRLTERLAAVATEQQIDYRHFRLTSARDYGLPPEPCVAVESDGVTLSVDLARSDLLLEPEIQRFAESVPTSVPGRRAYRLTPASVAGARQQGLSLAELSAW
ncbi:MAG: helicase-associated domain-containing protein, partial [Gemmataceae bacterium]|nr:helicase-associated domain-containing protein [Gemmataceae bacterium]